MLDVFYRSPLLTEDDTGAHAAHKSLSSNKNLKKLFLQCCVPFFPRGINRDIKYRFCSEIPLS